ncbi:6107_t:CDS:2 [Cetraspora pellucida]|uniref:6107_t:CDS:1 n=1 Tax=Cetraspora pellucida TaxID=1433469 RepID=A0A9N9EG64_9GLOM|nr:6107_t:CDS:2 [Cetraspora pellucida]
MLGTKATNKHNTYGVCIACDDALGREEALKSSLTNKKNTTDNKEELTSQIVKRHQNTDMSATLEFFEFLNPKLTLPSQYALSNHILNTEKTTLTQSREQKLKNNNIGVTLAFDEWKNILKQHIFSFLFILSTGESLIWKAIDISSERECMIKIISKIESMINEASDLGAKLSAIVSDSALAYSSARRRLRLLYPKIIFLPCFTYQCNLAVGEIFKESNEFKATSKQNLATTHKSSLDSLTQNSDDELVKLLHSLLLPYCEVLNKLQSDTAHLHEVLQSFGGILKMWEEYPDENLADRIILQLEQSIRDTWFKTNTDNLNFTYLVQFITYYYKAWFERQPTCILLEFEKYRKYEYPFDRSTYKQFKGNALEFWEFASPSTKELGPLAAQLFGICVNAASVEQLWSELDEENNSGEDAETNISDTMAWESRLQEWEQILIDEETAINYTHPAIDHRAKWELSSLFGPLFEKPSYMNSDS